MGDSGLILSIAWNGTVLTSIGICMMGPTSHIWSYLFYNEETSCYKITGFILGTFGQVFSIRASWEGTDEPILGCIALIVMLTGGIGYFNIQKEGFYPKYNVIFVTAIIIISGVPFFT
eukprot:UN19228